MARSIWKGPFVHPSLLKKVDKIKDKTDNRVCNLRWISNKDNCKHSF